MSNEQMVIPGLELLGQTKPEKKAKPATLRQRVANLERRVFGLELDVTLIQVGLEKGEKDDAGN